MLLYFIIIKLLEKPVNINKKILEKPVNINKKILEKPYSGGKQFNNFAIISNNVFVICILIKTVFLINMLNYGIII